MPLIHAKSLHVIWRYTVKRFQPAEWWITSSIYLGCFVKEGSFQHAAILSNDDILFNLCSPTTDGVVIGAVSINKNRLRPSCQTWAEATTMSEWETKAFSPVIIKSPTQFHLDHLFLQPMYLFSTDSRTVWDFLWYAWEAGSLTISIMHQHCSAQLQPFFKTCTDIHPRWLRCQVTGWRVKPKLIFTYWSC